MSLSRELIVAAKARADAATDGPWVMVTQGGIESAHYRGPGEDTNSVAQTRNQEDWEFVTAAREDVPVMADALLRVLDLHHAVTGNPDWDRPWYEATWCAQGCDGWPCATVRAVTGGSDGP